MGGLLVSALITPFVTIRIARRGDVTARRGQDLARSQSDRDLIKTAAELARSSDVASQRQGDAMLDGLSRMTELSRDDALLVQSLIRPRSDVLVAQERDAVARGETVDFELEVGPSSDEYREGDDDHDSGD